MNQKQTVILIIVIVIVVAGVAVLWTRQTIPKNIIPTPQKELPLSQSLSNATIAIYYPTNWGLALRPEQVLVNSYIPSCDADFDYCLYYIGDKYIGTNFESAGIRIKERTNLNTQQACLNMLPEGRSGIVPLIASSTGVATSVFGPLGDAATGHYALGALFRLSTKGICYEFETRIGQSRFENYEPGTVKEFTSADQGDVASELRRVIDHITLANGEPVVFPNVTP